MIENKPLKTCATCKYLKIGGANDNYRFACLYPKIAEVYITELTPACENYKYICTEKEE